MSRTRVTDATSQLCEEVVRAEILISYLVLRLSMTFTESLRRTVRPLLPLAVKQQLWKAVAKVQARRVAEPPGAQPVQWGRVVMNEATNELVSRLNPESLKVLEISGQDWRGRFNYKSYQSIAYPEIDICSDRLSETFDLIIAEQVFEHLLYPYRAGQNVYSMLNPNGHFLMTTPFLIKVHPTPVDCTRWTEIGLKHLLNECGFHLDNVITGSWGNRACVESNFHGWTTFNKSIHSLENEPDFPFVVWALAKREG